METTSKDEDGNETKTLTGYYVVRFESSTENKEPLANVRHILVKFEGGTTENGETVYSDEEKATAKQEAEKLLQEWKDGEATEESMPVLYLPVDKKTELRLETRDVIHSFWIIDFLYKKDMYIGKDNSWSFIPTRVGEYAGKCAELCGEYHSMMLFNVKVVEQDEYDAYIESLRDAGNTGQVGLEFNPNQSHFHGDEAKAENE